MFVTFPQREWEMHLCATEITHGCLKQSHNSSKVCGFGSEAHLPLSPYTIFCRPDQWAHKYFIHENHEIRAPVQTLAAFLCALYCVIPLFYSLPSRNFAVYMVDFLFVCFFPLSLSLSRARVRFVWIRALTHGFGKVCGRLVIVSNIRMENNKRIIFTRLFFLLLLQAIHHRKPIKSSGNEFR